MQLTGWIDFREIRRTGSRCIPISRGCIANTLQRFAITLHKMTATNKRNEQTKLSSKKDNKSSKHTFMFILHKNIPSLWKTTTSDSAEQRTRFVFKSSYKIKVKFHSPSMNVCFSSVESASYKCSVQERFQNLHFNASFVEQRAPSQSLWDVRCGGGVCLPWHNEAPRTGNEVAVFPRTLIPRPHDPVESSNGMDFRHGLWMVPTTWTTRKTMELTILLLKVIVSPFLLALSNVFYVSLPLKFKRGRSLRQAGNSSFISIPRNTEIWPCINLWQFIAQQKVAIKFRK